MEPIPYFYESIDRNAILVRPKQPFYDWANRVFSAEEAISERDECNIYLIREMASNEDVLDWEKQHFDELFVNELNDWYTDEAGWPQERTCQMFAAWFSVEVHSMVLDLEDGPLTKE